MRIAILGTRGVPSKYGGFETFADQFGTHLAARGHHVTVYCRSRYADAARNTYNGMRLIRLPAIPQKHAETLSHTLLSALHAVFQDYDIVYVCNSGNAPICYIPWLRRQTTVLNVDGLEWRRKKWGRVARRYYHWAARLAARMPVEVVTDADVIQDYYRDTLHRETRCFVYGTKLWDRGSLAHRLTPYGLEPGGYCLYVSRMEPENNGLLVVSAYGKVATEMPLVMIGDAPYAKEYVDRVKAAADPRVRFLGFVYGDDYHALSANAYLHVQATEVGGTHPALVEAMGHRNAVLAHDVPEHREVVGTAGEYFGYRDESSLTAELQRLVDDPGHVADLRERSARRVEERYSWGAVTDAYEAYFGELLASGRSSARSAGDAV